MSIEQRVRQALESEADAHTPVVDIDCLLRRGERVRRRRLVSVGTALAAVAMLVAATTWMNVDRAADPVAPTDGVPELPLLWTTPVGDSPEEVVVDPVHRFAYVSERGMAKVSVFDMAKLRFVDVIDVGVKPSGLALDSSAGLLYVACDDVATEGSVWVVDTNKLRAGHTVHLGPDTGPRGVALDSATHSLFVAESRAGAVAVVDTRSRDVVETVQVGGTPEGIAIDPAVGEVYVANGRAVVVLDLRTREVIETIADVRATTVDTAPGAGKLVAGAQGRGSVSVLSTRSHDVVGTVRVGGDGPFGVRVDRDASTVYVTGARGGGMAVVDLDRLAVVAETPATLQGAWYGQPAVDPENDVVWGVLGGFTVAVIPRL